MEQDAETRRITDFFSFYSLPSTIIKSTKYDLLEAATLYYYGTDVALNSEEEEEITNRLRDLIGDALLVADSAKFDVFNALTLMDTVPILQSLKVRAITGLLNAQI